MRVVAKGLGAVAGLVSASVLASCTSDPSPPDGSAEGTTVPSSTTPTGATATPGGPEPVERQPLAIATNVHRDPLSLTAAEARLLVNGRVMSWAALGADGDSFTVYRGPGALRAVERDVDGVAVVPARRLRPTMHAARVDGVDPLIAPKRYPLTTRGPTPVAPITTMTVVGDIMLGRRVGAASPDDPGATLQPLSPRLRRPDLTVGNLESTLSRDGAPRQGDDSFAADPRVVTDLLGAGFDLVSLANNHTGDFGPRALEQTLTRLDRSRLERVGAGFDAADAWAPVILRRNGITFGFLAFNAIGETPRATARRPGSSEIRMQPRTGPLSRPDLRRMTSSIERVGNDADVVVVMPHWGDQYTHRPARDQRVVGRALVEAGADIVVGGHPHWVQGVQRVEGGLVVHSLGNFVFDMDFSVPTQEGVMLDLTFWGDRLMSARLVPYVIGADFAPRRVGATRSSAILDDVWAASTGVFRS